MRPLTLTSAILTITCTSGSMACGADDDGSVADESSEASTVDPTVAESSGPSSATTTDEDTTGAAETTGVDESSDDAGSSEDESSTTGADASEFAALVRGPLVTDDLEQAQAIHDMIAGGGMEPAEALGDFGHDVLLGTTILGTTENQFLAVDRWTNLEGAQTLYGDPEFQAAFAMLFARPVVPQLFERRPDWHGWGEIDSADDTDPHFFVVVRGRLVDEPDAVQPMHDQLAMGGEAPAMQLGDVAHVVWLGAEDPREFFAVDVWTDDANIETFYGNPDFQAGFAMLFDGAPTVGVYRSTDWLQW